MEAERSFFKAVLRQFIENFTPRMTQKLSEYEFLAKSLGNKHDALTTIFRHFPSSSKEYITMVDTLVTMAKCDPVLILGDVLDLCEQVVENDRNNIFAAILSLLPLYNNSVEEHRMFLFQIWLFCVSDLVMRISQDHKVGDLHERMIEILIKIVHAEKRVAVLLDWLIHLWSMTVAAVSNDGGIEWVTKAFKVLVDNGKTKEAFKLVQFIDIKNDGFDEFKEAILEALRNGGVSEKDRDSCMSHLCRLIINCEKDEQFLNSIVELSCHETMVETIVRMIVDNGLTWEFVETRIMGAERPSTKALFWALTGPVFPKRYLFKYTFDMKSLLKNFEQRALEWDENERIVDKYMELVFPRGVFSDDHWACHFILIMIACRHFNGFLERIVPAFTTLEPHDPRMAIMLSALKALNELNILEEEQLASLNKQFIESLRKALFIFPSTILDKAVITSENEEILGPIINDHTQAVALFLDSLKIDVFTETVCSFSAARPPNSEFSVEILIVQVSLCVFDDNDLLELLDFWAELTCHSCSAVSEGAFKICTVLTEKHPSEVLAKLANIATESDSEEKMFHIVKLANNLLKTNCKLEREALENIDFIGICASVSVYPEVRMLGQLLFERVGPRLPHGGFYKMIKDHKKQLESAIKRRILLSATYIKGSENVKATTQTGEISVRLVCGSYFYDIWLLVISEVMNLMIAVNNVPILGMIDERLASAKTFRGLLLYVSAQYYYPVFDSLTSPYPVAAEGRNTEPSDDMQVRLYQILTSIIEGGRPDQALRMIQCVHFSFYSIVAQVLPFVGEDLIVEATRTLVVFLRSPEVTPAFVESMMVFILQFLQVVQNYFIQRQLNAPRVVSWDRASEEIVLKHQSVILNYILIIVNSLPDSQVSEEEWPIAARDLTFRFLINWSLTKCPELALVREYAMNGIVTISRVGQIFTDSLLFDKKVVKLFGKYERRGFAVAQYLLFYHPDLLLDIFILAYFCQSRKIADAYLESFLVLGGTSRSDLLYQASGQFLLLLFVLKVRGHELADELMSFFVKTVMAKKRKMKWSLQQIAKKLEEDPWEVVIPECFRYATEAVFDFAFNLFGRKLHVPVNDICDALVPWIANVRLLPKRGQCADDITSEFNFFTPYQFLTKFMEMSGVVKDDQFLNVSTLWSELMRSPDHSELIPLFFMSWTDPALKKKIFDLLLRNDPVEITKRLAQHCTFAYHYYVTECLEKTFEDELWVLKIIFEGFHRYWSDLSGEVVTVIHFVYLFRLHETADLFELICNKLEIDVSDEENLVQRIAEQLGDSEEWGNEALKWVVGSKSIRLASVSLEVYNQIKKPAFDQCVLARVVLYHVQRTPTEVRDLIMESFAYLANNFTGNEVFATDFLMSFIDSPIYVATSSTLLLKVLSSTVTRRQAWPMIVQMVKPLLGRLEGNESLEKMIDLFIRTSGNEELKLIIAPLKELEPHHFPSTQTAEVLMKTVNESTMCKCLAHYASMISVVSVRLANAIFGVATMILQRVPSHENNLIHLAKLYSGALHALSQSPNAVPFLAMLMQKEPSVASVTFLDFVDNERSLEDVERSLERLSKKEDEMFSTIMTDCKSYTNVVGFLSAMSKPKILPFVTHQDMIDGMLRVTKTTKIQKTLSLRRLNAFHSTTNTVIRSTVMSISSMLVPSASEVNMRAMIHPKHLVVSCESPEDTGDSSPDLIYTPEAFLSASTL